MTSPQSDVTANEPETLAQGLGFRIGRLARTLRRSWADELEALDLTPPFAAVLRGVHEAPGVSIRALARTLSTDAMSAKRCADELEVRGLLQSGSRVGDRRPRTLTLTPTGRTLVKKVNQRVAKRSSVLDSALSPGDRVRLSELLGQLERSLGIGVDAVATDDPDVHEPFANMISSTNSPKRKSN